MIVLIIILILIAIVAIVCIKSWLFRIELTKHFAKNNVIVFGAKGCGKDLLFQKIIKVRKQEYYSNLSYGYKYNEFEMKDLLLDDNTFDNFIQGEVKPCKEEDFPFENKDIYISEGGILLPSTYDIKLWKMYPSFPISYALSRHLWNNNIHYNSQNLERAWKALREQADYFIWCRGCIKLPFLIIIRCISYDKYQSALNHTLPMPSSLFNKTTRALKAQFDATNGRIKKGLVFVWKPTIKYDTRYFKQVVFGKTEIVDAKSIESDNKTTD